jgi:hypothetical protein
MQDEAHAYYIVALTAKPQRSLLAHGRLMIEQPEQSSKVQQTQRLFATLLSPAR